MHICDIYGTYINNNHIDIINICTYRFDYGYFMYVINLHLHLPGEGTYVKMMYCLIDNMYSFITYGNICYIQHLRICTFRFVHSAFNKQ